MKERNMGVIKLILLLLILFSFTSSLSFAHTANNYSGKLRRDESSAFVSMDDNGVVNQSKFAHAGGRGGGGGGGSSGGGNGGGRQPTRGNYGNGGESSSSQRGGGGAVIPVYAAAGAANKPNNHHNDAKTYSQGPKDMVLIIIASGLTSLLLHMFI